MILNIKFLTPYDASKLLIFTLPGITAGCMPYDSLLQSTLQSFHDQSCLNQMATYLSQLSTISILSSSSRFQQNTTINDLFNNPFIESWYNSSNYSEYYSTYAPLTCQYSYVKKNDVIYMLTTFLGLYGGLTIAIKSIVWYGLCIYRKFCRCFIIRLHSVEPTSES